MKNPVTPAGIEPATSRFAAQHLSHCTTAVPQINQTSKQNVQLHAMALKNIGKQSESSTLRCPPVSFWEIFRNVQAAQIMRGDVRIYYLPRCEYPSVENCNEQLEDSVGVLKVLVCRPQDVLGPES